MSFAFFLIARDKKTKVTASKQNEERENLEVYKTRWKWSREKKRNEIEWKMVFKEFRDRLTIMRWETVSHKILTVIGEEFGFFFLSRWNLKLRRTYVHNNLYMYGVYIDVFMQSEQQWV